MKGYNFSFFLFLFIDFQRFINKCFLISQLRPLSKVKMRCELLIRNFLLQNVMLWSDLECLLIICRF